MKARFLWATAIALILLSLPALVLAQPPIVSSTGPSGDGLGGGAPLGSPDALWDQPSADYWGVVSQYYSDLGFGDYSADDFSNASPWMVESIFVDGFGASPLNADTLHWLIYPDAAGVPAGYPGAGGELWSHTCLPTDPAVTIGGTYGGAVTLDIVQALGAPLYLPPGTYWLCFYPSLDWGVYDYWYWLEAVTTNLATAQIIGGVSTSWTPWPALEPSLHDATCRLEGYVGTPPAPPPPDVKYLHSTGGWMNITDPISTQWHELWPIFCREYHLSSWEDNGDGILSYCDTIDMYEKPDGELRPYHVENVTITLFLTPERDSLPNHPHQPMYIELEGGYNETALMNPEGTQWHEVYPNFCTQYNLTAWMDVGGNGIDSSDGIQLNNKATNETTYWSVEEVAVDIIITPEPPPVGGEAYPVSKASLLAPWIAGAMLLAGGISWYVLRRRRAQN